MATFTSIIKILEILLSAFQYFTKQIDLITFNNRLKKIEEACKQAGTGSIEERLEGGQNVEDNFNSHARKP